MTKQQVAFTVFIVLTVLCAIFALLTVAPSLAVERNFLFLGAVLFGIAAMQNA